MSEHEQKLIAIGFIASDDGVLAAPADSRVTLAPIGNFYELRISLADGNAIIAVLAKSAIKITREGANPISIESPGPLIG